MKKWLILCCLLAFTTTILLAAQIEVTLKSGRKIKGELVSEDANTLVIKRGTGGATMSTTIPVSEIASRREINSVSSASGELAVTSNTGSKGNSDEAVTFHPKLLPLLQNGLMNNTGRRISTEAIGRANYVVLYFSAHWCPPCQRFTPWLVNFYNQNKDGDNFEIIFVSSDYDAASMKKYMTEKSMPWVATVFNSYAEKTMKRNYAGSGIPCVVLLDEEDNVVSDTYVNGNYTSPDRPIKDLIRLLGK